MREELRAQIKTMAQQTEKREKEVKMEGILWKIVKSELETKVSPPHL